MSEESLNGQEGLVKRLESERRPLIRGDQPKEICKVAMARLCRRHRI